MIIHQHIDPLAFVCLNWNKKVYQWTTKQPIIINVEDSDDSSSHQEEKDEKIKHHSTPGPAQRTSTTQILTPINQSVSQPDDHHQLIISNSTTLTSRSHPLNTQKNCDLSPFANQRRPTHKNINNNHNHGIPSLLKICNQSTVLNFTTTIDTIDRNKTVVGEGQLSSNRRTKEVGKGTLEKIGEATYSEPLETDYLDAEKEIKLNQLLGTRSIKGFIDFKGYDTKKTLLSLNNASSSISPFYIPAIVVLRFQVNILVPYQRNGISIEKSFQNKLKIQDQLSSRDKHRNTDPECFCFFLTHSISDYSKGKFSTSRLYCCLSFGHAGKDLEASSLNGWQQAASILEQATSALSQAKEEYKFEHQDLHWGNLLIQSTEPRSPPQPQSQLPPLRQTSRIIHNDPKSRVKNVDDDLGELANSMQGISLARKLTSTMKDPLKPGTSGVRVSLLDCRLSRAKIVKEKPRNCYPKNKTRGTNTALTDHKILSTDPDRDTFGAMGNDYKFECYDLIGGYLGANGGGLGPSSSEMT
ncbi:hypothetical protein MJO28_005698 [Puccinia striiformis f. sp. tritici]|uniref:Uncharacterized protein n=1 Tax=Puccinia striiformis f. sp. tritici TaxID=168172 RepID=A0ACC0ELF8_9BASI|nr:hypothetical protein MJO28_005698 [Puccinia striiformis f. sp. tritici]